MAEKRNIPLDNPYDGEESLKTAKLTLNSYDSYDNVEDPSFAGDLDWRSWCNMSDHRPMVVHFDMYGS